MVNIRKCDICKIDVHRTSHAKQLRSEKTFREHKTG